MQRQHIPLTTSAYGLIAVIIIVIWAWNLFPEARSQTLFQPMKGAIDLLRSVKIATIVASGNEYLTDSLSYPACISSAVSVRATGDGSAPDAPMDGVSQFPNSSSFLNLLAPGDFTTSSTPGGRVEGGFGTSMAAHVSGAWIMLKEKLPAATVDDLLNKLIATGVNVTDSRNGVARKHKGRTPCA